LLFGQPLTVLNAITLIAAIPVTMIYRVSQGSYPFAKLATQSTQSAGALDIGANTIIRGIFRAILALIIGIGRAIADTLDAENANAPVLSKFLFGAILVYGFVAFTGLVGGGASTLAWVGWGIGLVMAITGATALFDFSKAGKAMLKVVMPIIRMVLGIGRLIVFCFAFAYSQVKNDSTKTAFARNLFLCLPPIVNPIKLIPGWVGKVGALVDAGVDVGSGLAVCAMDIALIFIRTEAAPTSLA
jgi:hypothetical protein